MPPVYNQGNLGSCTGNAIAAALEYDLIKQNLKDFTPSRLFIYYNERLLEGTVKSDSGAMIRDGIKTVSKQGACKETIWPYDILKFARKPTVTAYKDGLNHVGVSYYSVNQTELEIKTALASNFPVIFGFTVFSSFETQEVATTGIVKMPVANESVLGGHAVLIVGYDDSKRQFIVRNSWGESWGSNGYCFMPYSYITNRNLCSDFWVIRKKECN